MSRARVKLDPDVCRAITDLKELMKWLAPCPVKVLHDHLLCNYDSSVLTVMGTNSYKLAGFLKNMPDAFTVWKNENEEWVVDCTKADSAQLDLFVNDDKGPPALERIPLDEGPPPLEKIPLDEKSKIFVSDAIRYIKSILEQRGPCYNYVLHGHLSGKYGKAVTNLMGVNPPGLAAFLKTMPKDFTIRFQTGNACIIYLAEETSTQKGSNGSEHFGKGNPHPFITSRTPFRNARRRHVTQQDAIDFIVGKLKTTDHRLRYKHILWAIRKEAPELLHVTGPWRENVKTFLQQFPDIFTITFSDYVIFNENFQVGLHTNSNHCIQSTSNSLPINIGSQTASKLLPIEYRVGEHSSNFTQVSSNIGRSTRIPRWSPYHFDTGAPPIITSCFGTQSNIRGRGRIISITPHGGVLEATDGTAVTFGPHCTYFRGEPVCHSYFGKDAVVYFEAVFGKVISTATRVWQ